MKAIVYTQYGPPDVLQLMEVAKPEPKNDQVLVKVHAASVNALDFRRFEKLSTMGHLMEGRLIKSAWRCQRLSQPPWRSLLCRIICRY